MIESSLKTTAKANNEIEVKTRSTIALNTKLKMQSMRNIFEVDRDHVLMSSRRFQTLISERSRLRTDHFIEIHSMISR